MEQNARTRQLIKKRDAEDQAMRHVVSHVARAHGGSWSDFTDWVSGAADKVKHEFTDPGSILRSKVLPIAQQVGQAALEAAPLVGLGKRRVKGSGYSGGEQALLQRTMGAIGHGESGAGYSGAGKHRADARTRRPGPHALAVKKLLAENPEMSFGDASHYVKVNGLARK